MKRITMGIVIFLIASYALIKAAYLDRGYWAAGGEVLLIIAIGVMMAFVIRRDIQLVAQMWKWKRKIKQNFRKCPECGFGMVHKNDDVCPNCGADMRGDKSENTTKDI